MRPGSLLRLLLLSGAAAAAWPAHGQALAQPPSPAAAKTQRPAAPPKPQAAKTEVNLSATLSEIYSDNIYATTNYRQADNISVLNLSGDIARIWARGQVRLYGSGALTRYKDHPTENADDYTVGLEGNRKLGAANGVSGGMEYAKTHEERTSPDAAEGITPTRYDRWRAHAEGEINGRLGTLRVSGAAVRLDYMDVPGLGGVTIDSDIRDRREYELGLRYERPGEGRRWFAQGILDRRTYDLKAPLEPSRNSRGYSATLGLRSDSADVNWEIMAGVLGRQFDDSARKDVADFDFGGLLTVKRGDLEGSFRADRSLDETTLLGASTVLRTGAGMNLVATPAQGWSAGLGYSADMYAYKGIERTDYVTQASLWGRRNVTRHLAVELAYQYIQRNSDAAGADYDDNRIVVRLVGALGSEPKGEAPGPLEGASLLSGLYVGVMGGQQSLITGVDGIRGQGTNTSQFGDTGTASAVVAGYDVRVGSMLLGMEAEGGPAHASWVHYAERTFGVQSRNERALALHAGLILRDDNTVFASGGVVQTRFDSQYTLKQSLTVDTRRLSGLRFGLGLEAPVGRTGAFVRAEYLHASYPDYFVRASATSIDNFANSEQQFRIGFGFRPFAPVPTKRRPYDFSGLYAGAFVGQSVLTSANQGLRTEAASGPFLLNATRAGGGPDVGLVVGYGRAWRALYAGVELEGDVPTTNWNIDRDPTGRIYAVQKESSYTASVRVGVLMQSSALLYARLGVTEAKFGNNYITSDVSVAPQMHKRGDVVGAGLEVAATNHVRLRFEYSAVKYSKYDVLYGDLSDQFKNDEHRFTFGAVYAF